jgi:hypothetical protein
LEDALDRAEDLVDLGLVERALAEQLVRVDRQRRRVLLDRLVHHRLRERRLVDLVVAVLAVA